MHAEADRRRYDRHPIQVPVNVCTDKRRDRAGVIRDVSANGMLFHSQSKFAVGERVSLMFYVPHKAEAGERVKGTTAGHVVRAFVDDNVECMFKHVTAVRFDAPLFDLELAIDP